MLKIINLLLKIFMITIIRIFDKLKSLSLNKINKTRSTYSSQISTNNNNKCFYYLKTILYITRLVPVVFSSVLESIIKEEKKPDETYYDFIFRNVYFEMKVIEELKKFKKTENTPDEILKSKEKELKKYFNVKQINKLKGSYDCKKFDTSIIYTLFRLLFDLSSRYDESYLQNKDIEKYLKEVKEIRNKISHSCYNELIEIFGNHLTVIELKDIFIKILTHLKNENKLEHLKYNETLNKINKETDEFFNSYFKINDHELEWLDIFEERLRTHYRKSIWFPSIPFMFCDNDRTVSSCFTRVRVVNAKLDANYCRKSNNDLCSLGEILNHFTFHKHGFRYPPFIYIEGPPGSGKTFLFQKILCEWIGLEDNNLHFPGINQYKIVIYIQCRQQTITSLESYFREYLPEIFNDKIYSYLDFIQFIKRQNMLILIDGLDEMNDKSIPLIGEVLFHFSSKNIILTSRSEGINKLIQLQETPNKITHLLLNGIDELDWPNFIERYSNNDQDNLDNKYINTTNDLFLKLKRLPPHTKALVNLPYNLFLIIFLYKESQVDIEKFNLSSDLYNILTQYSVSKLTERIWKKNKSSTLDYQDVELFVRKIVQKIEELAFNCLVKNEMTIPNNLIEEFRIVCKESKQSLEISVNEILGQYLSYKMSDVPYKPSLFSFIHKTLQEFLAAKHAVRIAEKCRCRITDVFKTKFNEYHQLEKLESPEWHNIIMMVLSVLTNEPYIGKFCDNYEELTGLCCPIEIKDIRTIRQIMHCSKYHLGKEISKRLSKEEWIIWNNEDAFPAKNLISYTQPKSVTIYYYTNGENVEVCQFLMSPYIQDCDIHLWDNHVPDSKTIPAIRSEFSDKVFQSAVIHGRYVELILQIFSFLN